MPVEVSEVLENQRFWGVLWGPAMVPGYDWPAWSSPEGEAVQLPRPPSLDGENGWFVVRLPSTDIDGWQYGTTFERLAQARPGGRASKRANDQVRSRLWRWLNADQELQPRQAPLPHLPTSTPTPPSGPGPPDSSSSSSSRAPPRSGPDPGGQGGVHSAAPAGQGRRGGEPAPQPARPHISSSQILSALTSNMSYKQLPKASVFHLWQSISELWNEAAKRQGLLKVVPLDPMGLYFAMRQHANGAQQQRLAALSCSRLLAWAPASSTPDPAPAPAAPSFSPSAAAAAGTVLRAGPGAAVGAVLGGPLGAVAGAAVGAVGVGAAAGAAAALDGAGHAAGGTRLAIEACAAEEGTQEQQEQGRGRERDEGQGQSQHSPVDACGGAAGGARGGGVRAGEVGGVCEARGGGGGLRVGGAEGGEGLKAGGGGLGGGEGGCRPGSVQGSQGPVRPGSCAEGAAAVLLPDLADTPALLQELLTITNYTRAAYGYAMAAGHLASLSSMLQMVGYSPFFNPVSGASSEANNQAIHLLTGIPQEDILLAEWRNHMFRPCHFLAVDRAHRRLVLSIRGSLELGDICTDLAARPAEWSFGGGLGPCHVHQGLVSAAAYVEQSTHSALLQAAAEYPGWPLLLTGHSLGAGVATLLAVMLRHGHGPHPQPSPLAARVYCVGVACPPVLSLHVAAACDAFIVSLVHDMDFVPRLSFYSVELALVDLVRASPALRLADSFNATLAAVTASLTGKGAGPPPSPAPPTPAAPPDSTSPGAWDSQDYMQSAVLGRGRGQPSPPQASPAPVEVTAPAVAAGVELSRRVQQMRQQGLVTGPGQAPGSRGAQAAGGASTDGMGLKSGGAGGGTALREEVVLAVQEEGRPSRGSSPLTRLQSSPAWLGRSAGDTRGQSWREGRCPDKEGAAQPHGLRGKEAHGGSWDSSGSSCRARRQQTGLQRGWSLPFPTVTRVVEGGLMARSIKQVWRLERMQSSWQGQRHGQAQRNEGQAARRGQVSAVMAGKGADGEPELMAARSVMTVELQHLSPRSARRQQQPEREMQPMRSPAQPPLDGKRQQRGEANEPTASAPDAVQADLCSAPHAQRDTVTTPSLRKDHSRSNGEQCVASHTTEVPVEGSTRFAAAFGSESARDSGSTWAGDLLARATARGSYLTSLLGAVLGEEEEEQEGEQKGEQEGRGEGRAQATGPEWAVERMEEREQGRSHYPAVVPRLPSSTPAAAPVAPVGGGTVWPAAPAPGVAAAAVVALGGSSQAPGPQASSARVSRSSESAAAAAAAAAAVPTPAASSAASYSPTSAEWRAPGPAPAPGPATPLEAPGASSASGGGWVPGPGSHPVAPSPELDRMGAHPSTAQVLGDLLGNLGHAAAVATAHHHPLQQQQQDGRGQQQQQQQQQQHVRRRGTDHTGSVGLGVQDPLSHPANSTHTLCNPTLGSQEVNAPGVQARRGGLAQRQGQGQGQGPVGRLADLSKEELSRQLAMVKLYIPGRVLWMVYEDRQVIEQQQQQQQQQQEQQQQQREQQQQQQHNTRHKGQWPRPQQPTAQQDLNHHQHGPQLIQKARPHGQEACSWSPLPPLRPGSARPPACTPPQPAAPQHASQCPNPTSISGGCSSAAPEPSLAQRLTQGLLQLRAGVESALTGRPPGVNCVPLLSPLPPTALQGGQAVAGVGQRLGARSSSGCSDQQVTGAAGATGIGAGAEAGARKGAGYSSHSWSGSGVKAGGAGMGWFAGSSAEQVIASPEGLRTMSVTLDNACQTIGSGLGQARGLHPGGQAERCQTLPSGGAQDPDPDSIAQPPRQQQAVIGEAECNERPMKESQTAQQPGSKAKRRVGCAPARGQRPVAEEARCSGRCVVLLEADRTQFEQLSLVTSCASDHIPDTYYTALQQLYAASLPARQGSEQAADEGGCTNDSDAVNWVGGHATDLDALPGAVRASLAPMLADQAAHHATTFSPREPATGVTQTAAVPSGMVASLMSALFK